MKVSSAVQEFIKEIIGERVKKLEEVREQKGNAPGARLGYLKAEERELTAYLNGASYRKLDYLARQRAEAGIRFIREQYKEEERKGSEATKALRTERDALINYLRNNPHLPLPLDNYRQLAQSAVLMAINKDCSFGEIERALRTAENPSGEKIIRIKGNFGRSYYVRYEMLSDLREAKVINGIWSLEVEKLRELSQSLQNNQQIEIKIDNHTITIDSQSPWADEVRKVYTAKMIEGEMERLFGG
jgi:hypothetical protein